ncbi:hypothetical protein MCOR25_001072 [Pyricularia grisea]|uniref:Isochorismatase-like domain-containing protein n=1 Tax=Pyricularia grisea TaxID=148305 RepID=A0A6P8AP00_PYRGI|nr:uncharacterized protein PgNI_11697 [Pyricularia grisea]KAI6381596.1 hypothetical protein MCOR25_001072 [Pyricularia grisea]TLD03746.1 hypothetical protein PgNI_11697 [Pyricularia grisea]
MRPAVSTPTAILLVDVQEGFKHPTHWGESRSTPSFESNVEAILSAARAYNARRETNQATASGDTPQSQHAAVQIIHIHHHSLSPKSALHPTHTIAGSSTPSVAAQPCAAPQPDEAVLIKHHNSSFVGTDLEARLRSAGVRQLVVLGLTTDHCVSTTVRFAANLQVLGGDGGPDGNGEGVHGVVVVRDATATFTRGGFDAETVHAVSLASLDGEFARVVEAKDVLSALGA